MIPLSPFTDPTVLVPVLTALVGLLGLLLRAYLALQRRQEARDAARAESDRKNLRALESIGTALDAQRGAFARLEEEQRAGFRSLSAEIREAGVAAREATRELIAEIRSAFRFGGVRPGGPQ